MAERGRKSKQASVTPGLRSPPASSSPGNKLRLLVTSRNGQQKPENRHSSFQIRVTGSGTYTQVNTTVAPPRGFSAALT